MSQCRKCGTKFVGTPENPEVEVGLCKYCALIHKWRASANGHLRRSNGMPPGSDAMKTLSTAHTLYDCADELEKANALRETLPTKEP